MSDEYEKVIHCIHCDAVERRAIDDVKDVLSLAHDLERELEEMMAQRDMWRRECQEMDARLKGLPEEPLDLQGMVVDFFKVRPS